MLYTALKAVGKGKKPKKPVVEEVSEDEAPGACDFAPPPAKKARAPMSDDQKAKLKAGRDAKSAAKAAGFSTVAEHKADMALKLAAEISAKNIAAEDAKAAKKAAAKAKREAKKAEAPRAVQEQTPSASSVSDTDGKSAKRKPKAKKVIQKPGVGTIEAPIMAEASTSSEFIAKKRKFTEPKKFKSQRTKAIKIADRVEQEVTKQMKSRIFPDRVF